MITHVAVKSGCVTFFLEKPNRHKDIYARNLSLSDTDRIEGFLAEGYLFMDREEALHYVVACGQIKSALDGATELFSEDLW